MELALIKSFMDKDFYDEQRGIACPHGLFSKDVGKIKTMIDEAMRIYNRTLTTDELEGLYFASEPTMTTAQRAEYRKIFNQLRSEQPIGSDIASAILSKLYQQYVGEQVANIGFEMVNGSEDSLHSLRGVLDKYSDNFLPEINVEWDDISFETLMAKLDDETRWKFNIPSLSRKVEGVNAGHLIVVGARPNTGKTSFHASLIAGPGGFISQGANCIVLCNEESYNSVATRYLTVCSNIEKTKLKSNAEKVALAWKKASSNILLKDVTGEDMHYVESICRSYKPDILVLDMGDKFASTKANTPQHEVLKQCAIHARIIAKQYGCAVFYMSQLSADAQNRIQLDQSMMEGSKTGKAAEADLMLLIAKNPVDNSENDEEDRQRHINIAKNKLSGWHGSIVCELDNKIGIYGV